MKKNKDKSMAEYRKLVAELHFWQQKLECLSECFGMSNGERDSQIDSAEWNIRTIQKEMDELE